MRVKVLNLGFAKDAAAPVRIYLFKVDDENLHVGIARRGFVHLWLVDDKKDLL